MSDESPLQRFDPALFKDVHFEGILDNDKVTVVMPLGYMPQQDIPPPEVMDMLERMRQRNPHAEIHLARVNLYDEAPCFVCNQACALRLEDIPQDHKLVCWDCMEDQVPGFIDRMKAGEFRKGEKLDG